MTDEERIAKAIRSGNWMLGPAERERCTRHKRRWSFYRWRWPVDSGPESGDVEVVRSCAECLEADRDTFDD
jgi:hypothetical protein